ncbi:2637_t:CDS:2 [Entrophospora sp. SA101]|nr:2637_t:CDS:2 [Entrophospora sp. SA101]
MQDINADLPEILDLFDSFEEVGEVFVSVVVDDGGLGLLRVRDFLLF